MRMRPFGFKLLPLCLCAAFALAGCGEPRAMLLPLQYPDGTPVRSVAGEPVMAGYQTYGSTLHPNATALYEKPRPPTCTSCARVSAVVTEPSTLRQITGVLGTSAMSAGAVMTGIGMMEYGDAASEGKLGTNVIQNVDVGASKPHHPQPKPPLPPPHHWDGHKWDAPKWDGQKPQWPHAGQPTSWQQHAGQSSHQLATQYQSSRQQSSGTALSQSWSQAYANATSRGGSSSNVNIQTHDRDRQRDQSWLHDLGQTTGGWW